MFSRSVFVVVIILSALALALTLTPISNHAIDSFVVAMAVMGGAQRVIRLCDLPQYLGLKKSQIADAVNRGLLHPFPPLPGSRARVVTMDEVAQLQQQGMAEAAAKAAAAEKPAELPPNRNRRLARAAADAGRVSETIT
jgi:hypothetical protein